MVGRNIRDNRYMGRKTPYRFKLKTRRLKNNNRIGIYIVLNRR